MSERGPSMSDITTCNDGHLMLTQLGRRFRRGVALTVVFVAVLTACGDDSGGSNAQDQACNARSDLRSAVNDVVTDVRNGNFGAAKDGVSDIGNAFDELQSSLQDLG